MARGKQLGQLVTALRNETGRSDSVSLGAEEEDRLKHILRRTQETLYDDFDWPFLRVKPFKSLAAGQRYYDFPSDLNLDRIESVIVRWNDQPQPIEYGIGAEHYSAYDSENDERADPLLRWDIRYTGSAAQMEVWPIPATSTTDGLQFTGIRTLGALTSDSDTADLDEHLIVLFAAAEILARQKSEDAAHKLRLAEARYKRLKGQPGRPRSPINLAHGADDDWQRNRGKTIIRVS